MSEPREQPADPTLRDPAGQDPAAQDPAAQDPTAQGSAGPEPAGTVPAALVSVVREVEAHAARSGWDQPAKLFALAETADLVRREPQLAEVLGVSGDDDGFTPVEQEPVEGDVEELLAEILWPPEVPGCAAVVERLVLPPEADAELPEDAEAAATYAANHPGRQEVRIVAAALRSGESYCALRLRSHDDDASVVLGEDLVPALLELLHATLEPDRGLPDHE